MHAIILAAGRGERLGQAASGRPKCLLEFGGRSLLQRHLALLAEHAVDEVSIVTGYQSTLLEAAVQGSPLCPRFVFNPDYTNGSMLSLWAVRACLCKGMAVLLMDADVLYTPTILSRLIESDHENCFLLDSDFEPGEEPVKLCIQGGRPVEFRKAIDPDLRFDRQGESVGFFKFSDEVARALCGQVQRYINTRELDVAYEEAIRDLIHSSHYSFGYEDITGMPWIEIDFPEDIKRAQETILPRIQADTAS